MLKKMAKLQTPRKTNKKETKDFSAMFYLSAVILITFLVYSFSLFRPWQPFDERLFYNEEFLPIPQSSAKYLK